MHKKLSKILNKQKRALNANVRRSNADHRRYNGADNSRQSACHSRKSALKKIFLKYPKILVTGGAGFIGSAFVRMGVGRGYRMAVVDKLTYAGDVARLEDIRDGVTFYKTDICDVAALAKIFKKEKPDAVVHFAAETHVDRSIDDAAPFVMTNVVGTQILLDISRRCGVGKFVHISTDEVYGEIKKGYFTETSPFRPNSPYAASKAAADLLVQSYVRTYGFPALILRPSNNYGPWQYPEKLIPVVISRALRGERVPVYATGQNVREWLYVTDCAGAVFCVLEKGRVGEAYNVGSGQERRNIQTVKKVLDCCGKPQTLIEFVRDRPGHDFRYALDFSKIKKLGWTPSVKWARGIEDVVAWYVAHQAWLAHKS
jgi:dTDP-glucose 4,6-dehydratase